MKKSGRDCGRLLQALDGEPRIEQAVLPVWRLVPRLGEMLEAERSASARASLVHDLDATIREHESQVREGVPTGN